MFERILLTGAAGGLGSLLRKEIAPLTEVLRVSDAADLGEAGPNEEVVQCDLADRDAVLEMTRDVDMILHMGGVSVEDTFEAILQANIVGFYNVYEGCRKHGARRVIWGSSNHAIGFYPRTEVLDSRASPRPDSNYGVSKAFGENIAQYYWDKYRVETVSVRIGSCFPEPKDRRMLTTWLSYRDFVHLVERCLHAPRVEHTIVYGVSDNDMRLWDNRLASHLGYRPRDNAEAFREAIEARTPEPDRDDLFVAVHGGGFAAAGHFED